MYCFAEFHPDLIGLTGTTDEIRQVARAYLSLLYEDRRVLTILLITQLLCMLFLFSFLNKESGHFY
jgi:hypothetical protein